MNSTIDHLDRRTHLKIIAVAVLAAAMVLAIGKTAHLGQAGVARPAGYAPSPVAPIERHKAPAPTLMAHSTQPA